MAAIEKLLSVAFALAAIAFVGFAAVNLYDANIVDGCASFAMSLASAGACFDALNIFRFLFLGRLSRFGPVKEMPEVAKKLFFAAAVVGFPSSSSTWLGFRSASKNALRSSYGKSMAKPSALSLCFASLASALALSVHGQIPEKVPSMLSQDQLTDAASVSTWLRDHGSTVDRKQADDYFQHGLRAQRDMNWSAAAKAFGESAIRYPAPETLSRYADSELRMLIQLRMREKHRWSDQSRDLSRALLYYRSAVAAQEALRSARPEQESAMRDDADCLATFIESKRATPNCRPLQAYGVQH